MNTTTAAMPSPAPARGWIARLARERPRRGLVIALALSIALHGALSLWPAEVPTTVDDVPLQATITEMPPPPAPAPVAAAKPRPRPRRATAPPAPVAAPEPAATSEARSSADRAHAGGDRDRPRTGDRGGRRRGAGGRAVHPRASAEDAAAPRRPRLQGLPRHARVRDRRSDVSVRARGERIPDRDDRRGEGHRRALHPRPGQGRKPRTHHRGRPAAAGILDRARQQGAARNGRLRLGGGHPHAARSTGPSRSICPRSIRWRSCGRRISPRRSTTRRR